ALPSKLDSHREARRPASRSRATCKERRAVSLTVRLQFRMPEAIDQMVVDHAHRLHEGITDRAADKLKTASLEILAQRIGCCRRCGNFAQRLPVVLLGAPLNKPPQVVIKAAQFVLNF